MLKILDKIITAFFIIMFSILWYSTKCFVKPNQHKIIIYDIFGNQVNPNGIRVDFKTSKVAKNYIIEYQNRFSQYQFSMATEMPIVKKNWLIEKIKNN